MTVVGDVASKPLHWKEPEPVRPFRKLLPLMRAGVTAAPHQADIRLQLANALFRAGETGEIVDRWRAAVSDPDSKPALLYLLGRAALATDDQPLAYEALKRAVAGGYTPALGQLAETLRCLGRSDEALETALQRLETLPTDFASIKVVARVLLARGEAERLWNLCVVLRARGAWGSWFSTVMVSAAAARGIDDELKTLIDRPRWFSTTRLPGADDLNPNLAAELLALRPTGAEMRVDGLESSGGPQTRELLARIRRAVEVYVAKRETFVDDPMIVHRLQDASLYAWLIATHEEQHHDWHIHQAGWISGVYYVQMRPAATAGDDGAGGIEFGPYPFSDDETASIAYRWSVTPQSGSLLLFPSYYAHRTRPTQRGDLRICVPFDIRPARPTT